jgi:putative ABC transport system permease protein
MRWLHAIRARLRLLPRDAAENRMDRELDFHIDMEADRLEREEGLPHGEARRRALVAFGGREQHKEALRAGRGLAWLGGVQLDLKLGLRMLVKYPGLTIVATLGLAVAVAIGAISFALIYTLLDPPSVPLNEGDRIIAIHNIDIQQSDEARRTHLHDLATWREALTDVEQLGAFRTIDRNLITRDARPEAVRIAEMSAAGFRVARVAPVLGRYFNEEDERAGAPPVVVIGYSVWQARFAGDSGVIGRTIQLGETVHTVIGVMPRGFAFPINNRVWTPLRLEASNFERGESPSIDVFGRLAPDATLSSARKQLETIGRRLATAFPKTHEHIRPRILPYARAFVESPELQWMSHLIQLAITMLLVVIVTNVAILVYARTASRTNEIALRSALGASRRRIVGQLFAEALVLSVISAAVGLAVSWIALEQLNAYMDRTGPEQFPFWMHFGMSRGLVLYVLGLAVLGAVIVGALPALKATRRQLQGTLQQASGGTAIHLGKIWTVMIVAQVGIAVAALPLAIAGVSAWVRQTMAPPAFPPGQWMTATVHLDREGEGGDEAEESYPVFDSKRANRQTELLRLVRGEPGVVAAVLTETVPGEEPNIRIEVEGAGAIADAGSAADSGAASHVVQVGRVDPEMFRAFAIQLHAGTGVREGDAVVVNRSFVTKVLGGGDALGRRIRRVVRQSLSEDVSAREERWMEIVGVVGDFPNRVNFRVPEPRIYQALSPGAANPVTIAVRVRGGAPDEFGGRLREMVAAVDPMLRLQNIATLDESMHDRLLELRLLVGVTVAVTGSVLFLSAAGIYSLMSFTVTRRRREIGIRAALGASPRGIIWSILSRAMGQIAMGIAVGSVASALLDDVLSGGFTGGRGLYLIAAVAALVTAVGLLAAANPARRALMIPPTEALKGE